MTALLQEADVAQAADASTSSVVERYQDMVYAIALTHTPNKMEADDVFQEVFLAYHRKQPQVNSEEHRKAWLITTTLNCARRAASNSWRAKVVPMRPEDADTWQPEVFHFRNAQQDAIFAALGQLPEIYRIVIHLFYFEDQPVKAIAGLLGLEAGTVKMRLSRGRALMRTQIAGGYFDE